MENRTLPNEILLGEISSLLEEGREVGFTPKGTSMLPFIRGGRDSVTLKKMDQVRVGDIVLAHLPDSRYVLHRVVRLDGDLVEIMGDGNISGTERCRFGDVMGTAVLVAGRRPGRGRLWRALKPIRRYLLGIYRRII